MESATGAQEIGALDLEGRPVSGQLARNALGLPQVLFCIVTGSAPIAAMLFNVPYAVSGAGYAGPATFLVAAIILTIFSVGYIEMARRVTAAGGFYSFVSHGFGQVLGMGTAVTITLCYAIFSASVTGVTSYFANFTIDDWFGVNIPTPVFLFGTLAIMGILAYFHIELTAKILGVFLISELIGLLVFSFAVLFQGGDSGIHVSALNPLAIINNSNAKAAGTAAAGVAFFGAFWSWVGFEMAPNYAEESRNPKKLMAPALYISVIGLGVLFVFCSWMFVDGWGQNHAAQAIVLQFTDKLPHHYGSAFYPLTDRYFGSLLTWAFELLIVTGSFACQFAFFNTASRYLFSMGREGLLPRHLGRTHPVHKSPYVASLTVTAFVGFYLLGFVLYDSSTLASLLKIGTWGPLMGVTGILAIQALCSLAIIWYFWTKARDGFHWFKTLVAPLIGTAGMVFADYLLIHNRGALSGAAGVPFMKYMPEIVLVFFVVGVVMALVYRAKDPARYEAIGRFVHEDA